MRNISGTRRYGCLAVVAAFMASVCIMVVTSDASAQDTRPLEELKPAWSQALVGGETRACLTFEQAKNYLALYIRAEALENRFKLLDQELELRLQEGLLWQASAKDLERSVHAQELLIEELEGELGAALLPDWGERFLYAGAGLGAGVVASIVVLLLLP